MEKEGSMKNFSEKFLNPLLFSGIWHTTIFHGQKVLAVPIILQIQVTNPLFFGHKAWTSFLDFSLFVVIPRVLGKKYC